MKATIRALLLLFSITLVSFTNAQTLDTNKYYPLRIHNDLINSENVDHVYIIFMAKNRDSAAHVGGLKFDYNKGLDGYVGRLVELNGTNDASDFTFRIDTLKGYNDSTDMVTFMIPYLQSGRAMISVNYPLGIGINKSKSGLYTFVPPNYNSPVDPSYDIIADKFEFTFDSISKGAPHGTFYINPTSVDFFGLPIRLESSIKTSGAPTNMERPEMLDTIIKTITSNDKTDGKEWSDLIIKDSETGTVLRIASPTLAPHFDTSYLKSNVLGYNYIDSLIKYYQNNTITIDCSALDVKSDQIFDKYGKTPAEDTGAYYFTGTIDANQQFNFINDPKNPNNVDSLSPISVSIDMGAANSNNFFGPGAKPFDTPNKKVKSILVEALTSAFSVGLLPAADGDTIGKAYFKKKQQSGDYYSINPVILSDSAENTGPWYDLYSQGIHSTGAVIYAFAYDDELAQDGTISSTNIKDTITVNLGQIGDVAIPNPDANYLVQIVTIDSVHQFNCVDSVCTLTAYWTVPNHQSVNTKYFLMLDGPGFSISADSIVYLQLDNLLPYNATSGSLTIHQKYLGYAPEKLSVEVFSCGQDSCGYPTLSTYKNWDCASGTDPFPKLAPPAPILPVQNISVTPFAYNAAKDSMTLKVNWTVPPNQSTNAHYFVMLNAGSGSGATFSISADDIVKSQLEKGLPAYNATEGSVTISVADLGSDPAKIGASVFTCGKPQCSCPTIGNYKNTTCSPGAGPVFP